MKADIIYGLHDGQEFRTMSVNTNLSQTPKVQNISDVS